MRIITRPLILILLVVAIRAEAQQPQYSLTDLGTLGGASSGGKWVNSSGQVVGWALDSTGSAHIFLYSNGTMSDLGGTSWCYMGSTYSLCPSINDSGQIVTTDSQGTGYMAVLLANGTPVELGTLGGQSSWASAINSTGQITGCALTASGAKHAFLFENGTMTDLGIIQSANTSSNGNTSCGTAINASGQIVGIAQVSSPGGSFYDHVFVYSNGVMTDLGQGDAYGINTPGQIVGYFSPNPDAAIYDNGTKTDLGNLGGTFSSPLAINDLGQVVGYANTASCQTCSSAFVYTPGVGMIDLNSTIPPNSGYVLQTATSINNDGLITGTATYPQGKQYDTHAFLLTPVLASTTTSIQTSLPSATYGNSVTFTVTVTSSQGTPTGTVDIFDNGVALARDVALDGSAHATCSLSTLGAGTHAISASYAGDFRFTKSTTAVPLNQVVLPAPTTVALTASSNSVYFGQSITFTATVSSAAGGPNGTVSFMDGSSTLGSATLANGVAVLSTASLAASTHVVTAQYSGATDYLASTSATLTVVVNTAQLAITGTSSSLSAKSGQSASTQVTLQAMGTISGSITFSCSGLPTAAACTFSPASLSSANLPATETVTITTTAQQAAQANLITATLALVFPGLIVLPSVAQGRRNRSCLSVIALLSLLVLLNGCGGSASTHSSNAPPATPPGTYSVSITATAQGATQGKWDLQFTVTQ